MEVGIDLEQNKRFENVSNSFLNRVFTKNEQSYANKFSDKSARLCSLWCLKEAVIKAFSDSKLNLKDIEIYHNQTGKPQIKISQKIQEELNNHNTEEL